MGFVPLPLFWGCVLLYLRSPNCGYCSISDDLSSSLLQASSLFIFPLFIQPKLTRNWKTDSRVLSKTPSFFKNGSRRYKYLVLGHEETYLWKSTPILKSTLKYKKRPPPRRTHHFISDLIYNMDHMRISGTEPSSVIPSNDIIKMPEFLVDNIFMVFAWKVFQQTVGIPMGKNCAPLLADIFLYSHCM